MGDVTPIRGGHIPLAQRISDLPIIGDVDEMLHEGLSAPDVAKHIQQTFELLTDVSPDVLRKALGERRKNLPVSLSRDPTAEEWPAAYSPPMDIVVDNSNGARMPGVIAKAQYRRATRGIDAMLETESLYLAQRDRIDRLITSENTTGEPYEEMPREMGVALEMLRTHAKLQEQFGSAVDRMRLSLDISGGAATGLGQKIASVMQDPESRHKVLSMVKRFTQLASLPVMDVEADPVGGG
jgi:hypothetical protein